MKAILKSITLTDFKGVVGTVTYNMHEQTRISGRNEAGKSTIADGYFWVLADKDYSLTSNPNIRPNDGRECTPTVTLDFDIDGKPVTVTKMQKMKKSKPDENGIVKTFLTNSYEVNSVPKSERDFKAYLEDLGVDFNLILPLSHPDMFLKDMNEKKQKEAIRKILFGMANTSMSDLDIASSDSRMKDLAELLVNYSIEEVTAMQNTTKRKIAENYGKDGDILRAKIEGMESSKSHLDKSELEVQKKALQEAIADIESRIESTDKQHEAYKKLSDGVLELKFKLSDLERKANMDKQDGLRKIENNFSELYRNKNELIRVLSFEKSELERLAENLERKESMIAKCRDEWKESHERVFDESNTVCPYCGQEYPEEKKDALRAEFESHKADELKGITDKGSKLKVEIEADKAEIERVKISKADNEKKFEELSEVIVGAENEKRAFENATVNMSNIAEWVEIKRQIAEKEQAMAAESDTDTARDNLKAELSVKRDELIKITNDIALADNDKKIDEQIEEKRKEGLKYEQERSDCERILYQVDLLNRRKNELLEESINKHFKIVRWRLFKFQKNGEYLDDCTPTYSGKAFGSETNTSLELRMKLDIIRGLQNFYGQHYPVFVDGAECLDDNSLKEIEIDCQTIFLKVSNDKEMKFEEII